MTEEIVATEAETLDEKLERMNKPDFRAKYGFEIVDSAGGLYVVVVPRGDESAEAYAETVEEVLSFAVDSPWLKVLSLSNGLTMFMQWRHLKMVAKYDEEINRRAREQQRKARAQAVRNAGGGLPVMGHG